MARIRTFKPEFLRHEELQALESKNVGKYPMFVFMGLWSVCDKQGVFPWKPLSLKLDIYPFLDYDMEETLNILFESGFIQKFKDGNDFYGFVVNFEKHQRITGLEGKNPAKYPKPDTDTLETQQRHTQDTLETQQGSNKDTTETHLIDRERERERERERNLHENSLGSPDPQEFSTAIAVDPKEAVQDKTALIPSKSRSPPKKTKKTELTPEQLALFHAAKACFEASEKAKSIMYQDDETTAREMKHLKTLVIRCTNMAPGISAVFLQNVLEHFRVMTNGKLKNKAAFTPRGLITPWIWELVIDSLPENNVTPELREIIRGLFK
jgi:hypothetical protein